MQPSYDRLRHDLIAIRDLLEPLQRDAGCQPPAEPLWRARLIRYVLPSISLPVPVLMVTISGGGSTGKSSLFNALAGAPLAQVAFQAGLTRRILLAGHPDVLTGAEVARALLYRLPEAPVAWQRSKDTVTPGPPLFATSRSIPRNLLLLDTPDFDTGDGSGYVNRSLAEPVLRTAEVLIYLFTNAVYNNLANTAFMAEIVGGIGGRPTILAYRISRAADETTVLEHCRHVAQRLYGPDRVGPDGMPPEVVGVYRIHESDRVARGQDVPRPMPVGSITKSRSLETLLGDLDAAAIKRQVLAGDLAEIAKGSQTALEEIRGEIAQARLYEKALHALVTRHALESLRAFPVDEALAVAMQVFVATSPPPVRALRNAGRVVGAPLRGLYTAARWAGRRLGYRDEGPEPASLEHRLRDDMLRAAGDLRNQLLEGDLIVPVAEGDDLVCAAQTAAHTQDRVKARIEDLGRGLYHLHVPAPRAVQARVDELIDQDWGHARSTLEEAAHDLAGLPHDIQQELQASVSRFRAGMSWPRRLREALFASLTALPPVVGVTYALLTANPALGTGIWIELEGLFGLNDLWALVAIPASAGLTEQDRRQLELMIAPVFRAWLSRRTVAICDIYRDVVFAPISEALASMPGADDSRLTTLSEAIARLSGDLA